MSNKELNTLLIEHFGNLERLCNQIYENKHGVTSYIEHMERINPNKFSLHIKRLKSVRHKRNNLSHGEVSFNEPYANEEDIKYIIDFRKSILSQTDPLTIYRKMPPVKTNNVTSAKTIANRPTYTYSRTPPPKKEFNPGCVVPLLIWLILSLLTIIFTAK